MRFLWLFNPDVPSEDYLEKARKLEMNWVVANPFILEKPGFIEEVKRAGLLLGLNFPVFMDADYLSRHPDFIALSSMDKKAKWEWYQFACPSKTAFLEYRLNNLKSLLQQYEPDLVSLDFIRHHCIWEKVDKNAGLQDMDEGCYCLDCRKSLAEKEGFELQKMSPSQLKSNALDSLSRFRVMQIDKTLLRFKRCIKEWNSSVPLMLKMVPWSNDDKEGARIHLLGQDMAMMKTHADIISVMSFLHTIGEKPSKMQELTKMVKKETGKKVMLSLQLQKIYDEAEMTKKELMNAMRAIKMSVPDGFNLFDYDQIPESPCSLEELRDFIIH